MVRMAAERAQVAGAAAANLERLRRRRRRPIVAEQLPVRGHGGGCGCARRGRRSAQWAPRAALCHLKERRHYEDTAENGHDCTRSILYGVAVVNSDGIAIFERCRVSKFIVSKLICTICI